MNRSTRPSSGSALSADGNEIAKRSASRLVPCSWVASATRDEAPNAASTQPAASVERIKAGTSGDSRGARAHVTTHGAETRIGDGILERMASSYDCDVVVAGGGPAGSTAAALLARSGRRVVLLERDRFPRFHIGESLLASVNDVLRAIGADDLVRGAGFTQKWGATFLPADGSVERHLDFGS